MIVLNQINSQASICCPAAAKEKYNEMRCSGLDVISTAFSMNDMGFSTAYTVPMFMLNTKEYRELSKQRQEEAEGQ